MTEIPPEAQLAKPELIEIFGNKNWLLFSHELARWQTIADAASEKAWNEAIKQERKRIGEWFFDGHSTDGQDFRIKWRVTGIERVLEYGSWGKLSRIQGGRNEITSARI